MKKLKDNQIGPWCTFCKPERSRAVYVQSGWSGRFCCEEHKTNLEEIEQREERVTEADEQTWMRL